MWLPRYAERRRPSLSWGSFFYLIQNTVFLSAGFILGSMLGHIGHMLLQSLLGIHLKNVCDSVIYHNNTSPAVFLTKVLSHIVLN